jgi:hypothetical protein
MEAIRFARPLFALATVLLLSAISAGLALAHEHRDVGPYAFTVGFFVEPAYEAIPNAVSVRIANDDTEKPVTGLEKTLKVEVTHVVTGKSKTMDLRTVFGDPGHYRADLIPTQSGQFRFRFFGKVEDLEVNETFESGPGRFNDVTAQSELQFPEPVTSAREVQAAVRGANTSANEALDKASSASTLGVIGIVLGAIGTTAGIASIAVAMRRKKK